MKKLVLFSSLFLFGVSAMFSQGNFRAGAHLGLPIGDAGDLATFAIAVDLGYILEISENFEAGPIIGYQHSFGDEVNVGGFNIDVDDVQFLPIGGEARFNISDSPFSLRAQLGYALGINDGNDGGFYYSPQVSYGVSESTDIVLAFRGISRDGGSWDVLSLGVEFGID